MQINEELKEKLIEEYIKKKSAELKEADKKEYKITYGYLLGGFFLFFSILACIHIFKGELHAGIENWGYMTLAVLLIIILSVPAAKLIKSKDNKKKLDTLREYCQKSSYHIDEENNLLVREYEGDKRRTKKYNISKIFGICEEDGIISFDYRVDTIEILDFYEPSLYSTLIDLKTKILSK